MNSVLDEALQVLASAAPPPALLPSERPGSGVETPSEPEGLRHAPRPPTRESIRALRKELRQQKRLAERMRETYASRVQAVQEAAAERHVRREAQRHVELRAARSEVALLEAALTSHAAARQDEEGMLPAAGAPSGGAGGAEVQPGGVEGAALGADGTGLRGAARCTSCAGQGAGEERGGAARTEVGGEGSEGAAQGREGLPAGSRSQQSSSHAGGSSSHGGSAASSGGQTPPNSRGTQRPAEPSAPTAPPASARLPLPQVALRLMRLERMLQWAEGPPAASSPFPPSKNHQAAALGAAAALQAQRSSPCSSREGGGSSSIPEGSQAQPLRRQQPAAELLAERRRLKAVLRAAREEAVRAIGRLRDEEARQERLREEHAAYMARLQRAEEGERKRLLRIRSAPVFELVRQVEGAGRGAGRAWPAGSGFRVEEEGLEAGGKASWASGAEATSAAALQRQLCAADRGLAALQGSVRLTLRRARRRVEEAEGLAEACGWLWSVRGDWGGRGEGRLGPSTEGVGKKPLGGTAEDSPVSCARVPPSAAPEDAAQGEAAAGGGMAGRALHAAAEASRLLRQAEEEVGRALREAGHGGRAWWGAEGNVDG